jgi:hypothetical protein
MKREGRVGGGIDGLRFRRDRFEIAPSRAGPRSKPRRGHYRQSKRRSTATAPGCRTRRARPAILIRPLACFNTLKTVLNQQPKGAVFTGLQTYCNARRTKVLGTCSPTSPIPATRSQPIASDHPGHPSRSPPCRRRQNRGPDQRVPVMETTLASGPMEERHELKNRGDRDAMSQQNHLQRDRSSLNSASQKRCFTYAVTPP